MHFMLQKEVVERLAAVPAMATGVGCRFMVQYHCRVEHLFNVGPGAFNPRAKVDSAIVRLVPHTERPTCGPRSGLLERVVREAFGQRRKPSGTPQGYLDSAAIEAADVDPGLRPEQLDLAAMCALAIPAGVQLKPFHPPRQRILP